MLSVLNILLLNVLFIIMSTKQELEQEKKGSRPSSYRLHVDVVLNTPRSEKSEFLPFLGTYLNVFLSVCLSLGGGA